MTGELDASPERDAGLRQMAVKMARDITAIPPQLIRDMVLEGQTPMVSYSGTNITIVFYSVDAGDVLGNKSLVAEFIPKASAIALYILPPKDVTSRMLTDTGGRRRLGKMIVDELPGVLRKILPTLVHELTHAIDIIDRRLKPTMMRRDEAASDFTKYVSSAHEFNAYFQQTMYELEKELQHMKRRKLADMTFEGFFALMKKTPTFQRIGGYLDEKYRRKWFSRAYQSYVHVVEQAST